MTIKISHIATIFVLALSALVSLGALAAEESPAFRSTSFPLPRFVSLSSSEVFVRSGPGSRYPVKWAYHKKALPVEVILEYEVWRKIRDVDGETGWVHQSMISGKRTGMIKSDDKVALRQKPKENGYKIAMLEPRVVVGLEKCQKDWCRISASGYHGWLERSRLWGVYDKETIE